MFVTYSRPVLPYKPQVVAEEGQNTDAEHGGHKKKKQDMEFGVSVFQVILGGEMREGESETAINNNFTCGIFVEQQEQITESRYKQKEKRQRGEKNPPKKSLR